jgi:hypothetical protein
MLTMNCLYRININGHFQEFSSEDELNSFLRDNKRTMAASLLSDKVMFSNDRNTQQQVLQELKGLSSEITFKPEYHQFFRNEADGPAEYTPVTKVITQGRERLGRNMVQPFDIQAWESRTVSNLVGQLDENQNKKYTEEQAHNIANALKSSWQVQALLGTSWHNVAQAFFDGKLQSEKDITDQFPELSKVSNYVLTKYIKSLTDFRNTLYRKYPNSQFLTEINLFDKEKKIAGIADLLVVDETGKIHIYDYKTSVKSELEWYSNKNESNRYQLAFYRQMLRRAGYNVASTHIVPIELKEVDLENKTIQDFDMGRISTKYFKEIEPLMQNIKEILPYNISTQAQQVTENTSIHQFMKEAFNYEQKKTVRGTQSVDDEYDRMMSYNQQYPNAHNYYYKPFNANNISYQISKKLTIDEIKTKVADYLQQIDESNSRLPDKINDFVTNAKEAMEQGATIGEITWGGKSKDGDTNIKIRALLYKYITDPSWEILQSDSLSDLNLVAFENNKTNELDFISLSSESIDKKPKLVVPGAKTILGNFMTDNKANQLGIYAEATNGDVELLKAYDYIKNNKQLFVDKRIGSIYTLNILEGDRIPSIKSQTLDTLEKWHTAIKKVIPTQLGLEDTNWEPQQIDKSRAFISYISDLMENKSWKAKIGGVDKIKNWIKEYNDLSYTSVDEKVEVLGKFSNQLRASIANDYRNISSSSENNDIGISLKLASEAIHQLKKIPMSMEEDMKQWNYLFNQNTSTTSPELIRHQAQQSMVTVVKKTLNNVRSAFMGYVNDDGGLRDIHDKLYSRMSSVVQIKALGYNLPIFEKMLEYSDGKPIMRFKDPNSKDISQPQREYINAFLDTINKVRIGKMIKSGKTDLDIDAFMSSPDSRNIPLLKASALTAFKGKNFKQFTDDFFRDLMNPNNIFSDDKESTKRIDAQSKMFNSFDLYDLNLEKRAERIDTSSNGEFETDLELVLATYMMSHHKEIEVNKNLPIINAIQTSIMMNEIYGFNASPNVIKLQKDYLATTIFGKSMLAGESAAAAKVTQGIQQVTSGAMMWINPLTGATDFFSGLFGNVVRLMANKYNDHSFGLTDYMKAHALFAGTVNENKTSFKHVGFCDAINEMYGLADMDVQRAAHEVIAGSGSLAHFKSRYAYWFNKFPGYFNRMVLFLSRGINEGVIDVDATGHLTKNSAYQMIDSHLVYNEKLDKRFSLYTNNKDMQDSRQTDEYKKQKALYIAIKQDLEQEPNGLKSDGSLARAYSNRQKDSIKSFADEVHGSYDKIDKTNFQKMAFGRMFMQFKGWLTAKKNRWYTETHINEQRGNFELAKDNDGNLIHNDAGEPVYTWKGKVTEGITQSILAMAHELNANKFNVIKSWDTMNKSQRENFMFLLSDTLVFGLMSLIVGSFMNSQTKKEHPGEYELLNSLHNSSRDFFIGSTISAVSGDKNPVALASWSTKVLNDTWGVATGNKNVTSLMDNVAIFRNLHRLTATGN